MSDDEDYTEKVSVVLIPKISFYKCSSCYRAYLHSQDYAIHSLLHDKWNNSFIDHILSARIVLHKKHRCDECNKVFDDSNSFHYHRLAHIQRKMYNYLKGPKINDSIEKPYHCTDCDAKFALESTLETHCILHKPFPNICFCGIGYYKKSDLKQHIKLVHPTKEEKDIDNCGNEDKLNNSKPSKTSKLIKSKPSKTSKDKSKIIHRMADNRNGH